MKDDLKQFEQRLRRQPVKQIPSEWRAEILSAAREAQSTCHSLAAPACRAEASRRRECGEGGSFVIRHSWLKTIGDKLTALLWPHPAAWAGLAAVWIFIFAVNFSLRGQPAVAVVKAASPSPEVIAQLHEQHKLYAELMGISGADLRDADRPRIFSPKPRSERTEILAA